MNRSVATNRWQNASVSSAFSYTQSPVGSRLQARVSQKSLEQKQGTGRLTNWQELKQKLRSNRTQLACAASGGWMNDGWTSGAVWRPVSSGLEHSGGGACLPASRVELDFGVVVRVNGRWVESRRDESSPSPSSESKRKRYENPNTNTNTTSGRTLDVAEAQMSSKPLATLWLLLLLCNKCDMPHVLCGTWMPRRWCGWRGAGVGQEHEECVPQAN